MTPSVPIGEQHHSSPSPDPLGNDGILGDFSGNVRGDRSRGWQLRYNVACAARWVYRRAISQVISQSVPQR